MARKGREFELLIEMLEKNVLPEGATIKTPAFLPDKITGEPREVDILIEFKVGTTPINIIIECRDRKSMQDVTWIEQIHSKVQDLNVNKVIAVSSSQFTGPAKTKAKFYGIETRIFSEIDYDVIKNWWAIEYMQTIENQYFLISAKINTDTPDSITDILQNKSLHDKFINRCIDDHVFSVFELFSSVKENFSDLLTLKLDESPQRTSVTVHYTNDEDYLLIRSHDAEIIIRSITYTFDYKIVSEQIPIKKIATYSDDEKIISHVIKYDVPKIGQFQIIKNPDGSISMSILKNI